MNEHIKLFETHSDYEEYINSQDKILPNVSFCKDLEEVHYNEKPHDYSQDYLTTIALENGIISFNIKEAMGTDMITSISYSTNKGETWTTTNNTDEKSGNLVITVNVNKGDNVLWKGDATQLGYTTGRLIIGSFFSSTCKFDVNGNIMSLLYSNEFKEETTIENNYGFACLFSNCSNVLNAKDLSLPATTLTDFCYSRMFDNCTSLITAPKELPATTLAACCYYGMFDGCTSLTIVPELLATTLVSGCYRYMFYGCANLNYIKAMFTTTPSDDYTMLWVDGVAATGTFVRNNTAQWYVIGTNGIPSGWTVELDSFGGDDNGEIDSQ